MLKRMKKVSPSYGYEEVDAQTRFEFQRWKQEYNELLTATKAKKKNLQKAKRRRCILRAEVQFLRQRYEYLMSIQSPTPLLVRDLPRNQVPQTHEVPLPKERIYRDREMALPNCALVIDLNQISTEEEEQLQIQNVAEGNENFGREEEGMEARNLIHSLSRSLCLSLCLSLPLSLPVSHSLSLSPLSTHFPRPKPRPNPRHLELLFSYINTPITCISLSINTYSPLKLFSS